MRRTCGGRGVGREGSRRAAHRQLYEVHATALRAERQHAAGRAREVLDGVVAREERDECAARDVPHADAGRGVPRHDESRLLQEQPREDRGGLAELQTPTGGGRIGVGAGVAGACVLGFSVHAFEIQATRRLAHRTPAIRVGLKWRLRTSNMSAWQRLGGGGAGAAFDV